MSEMPDDRSAALRIERTFAAPAQAVFDAWTSVEVLRRWWHAEHDWETPVAEVDLRVGGTIRLVMRNPVDGTEYGGSGEFTVIAPPRQLAFTWSWDDVPGRQVIELELTEHERRHDGGDDASWNRRGRSRRDDRGLAELV